MVVEVSFNALPKKQTPNQPIIFSGYVYEDGAPLTTQNVIIILVETYEILLDTYTDYEGKYYGEWIPTTDYIGSFNVQAFVPIYQGIYTDPITITVATELPPETPAILPLLAALGIGFIAMQKT